MSQQVDVALAKGVPWVSALMISSALVLTLMLELQSSWPLVGLLLCSGALQWYAPRRLTYVFGERELVISRLLGKTKLLYTDIAANTTQGRLRMRLGGTGILGYYTGLYTFHPDTRTTVLAASSRMGGGVLLTSGKRAYFLTPADPDAFLAELQRRGATVTQ